MHKFSALYCFLLPCCMFLLLICFFAVCCCANFVCNLLCVQQSDTDQVQSGPSFVVVVAIDFGTTSSGYAYAFTKEPECIHTMRWANTAMQKLIGVKPGEWDESRKAQYYPVDSVLKQFTDI
ncbi:hypothetical protein ATANTOWER_030323 [Ataeniobius toweri]|uniref:Uncharacterized protein n=1 Tax=Ataeniobius toweri TaxID=208326 RepID=A0ABU7CIY9_9TELE|nr:hypothetical protein [Ataeniobius toweri]